MKHLCTPSCGCILAKCCFECPAPDCVVGTPALYMWAAKTRKVEKYTRITNLVDSGMTYAQVAEEMGVHPRTVARVVNGS